MASWKTTAEDNGWRLPSIQEETAEGKAAILGARSALWIVVGGYSGSGATRQPHENSAVCGAMQELCLFAPWSYTGNSQEGTAVAAAQTAALLDTFLLVWPDYDLLALRDFVFECAEDMGAPGTDKRWGRGILNAACLFTPQGDLKDPRTGAIISGSINGPITGLHDPDSVISGFDRTGRDFAYPVTRWAPRENHALLAATANFDPQVFGYRTEGVSAVLLDSGALVAKIAAAGDAVGAVAQWRPGGRILRTGLWTFRGGLALQQEGAGPLTGEQGRLPSAGAAVECVLRSVPAQLLSQAVAARASGLLADPDVRGAQPVDRHAAVGASCPRFTGVSIRRIQRGPAGAVRRWGRRVSGCRRTADPVGSACVEAVDAAGADADHFVSIKEDKP